MRQSASTPRIIDGETRLFPIIGDPIRHVQSPQRLTAGFAARGQNALCVPALVPDGALPEVMRALSLMGNVDGLLVTMPHKFKVVAHCATTSDRTKLLGAASVVRRNADGSWHGDMLDGLAFLKAQRDAGARPEGARVLLVGAGGAGGAIAVALLDAGARELIIHDRDGQRAQDLLNALSALKRGRVTLGPPNPTGCAMVCNASSAGMNASDELPVEAGLLAPTMFVGDVISGHGATPFLRAAQVAGCKTAGGDQMVDAVQEIMLDFMLHRAC
jgi:shikimate dehydrogenase